MKQNPGKLADFIDEQTQSGPKHAEGSFTIQATEAIRKLARFRFKEPGLWAIKLIQAFMSWKGTHLERFERTGKIRGLKIRVSHAEAEKKSDPGIARTENASVSKELSRRCFTCPVPLFLDGRRIDGLQWCSTHGWTPTSYPIGVSLSTNFDPMAMG